ncbi:malectin-A [Teleopsis dalmanni]|uniref:malectin-A n=1 Tax=Teleopsis dalmanni TaxID=139649 RepID=UPI0018CDCC15|nr:malectin-A [Teleopsis dalmanni]
MDTRLRLLINRIKVYICLCILVLALLLPTNVRAQQLKVVYAVNAGGYEHTDKNGIHYEADPLHDKVGTGSDYGNHLLIIGRVPEQDEVLYRTERYHTATFGYEMPLDGDGDYALIMKFCEVYFNEPNMKIFDVVLNKRHTVVNELDIFHQVGRGTAHEEYAYFTIKGSHLYYKDEVSDVRNNIVRLDFIKSNYDNPKINAFVLLKGDVDHIPRLTPVIEEAQPIDGEMAAFNDRISADSGRLSEAGAERKNQETAPPVPTEGDLDDDEEMLNELWKVRKTSGPRHPDPYSMDDTSLMLPIFIAIGAFIPLVFCLCKL